MQLQPLQDEAWKEERTEGKERSSLKSRQLEWRPGRVQSRPLFETITGQHCAGRDASHPAG
eukprot:2946422-Alexandrium_andersonii.AAC.1